MIQNESKIDEPSNLKEVNFTNSTSLDPEKLISIEKYNKLKRKFSVLRKVSQR